MRDHELTLVCDFYTPTDAELIPTGEIRAVAGTPFDFREARPIRNAVGADLRHQFRRRALPGRDGLAPIATLRSPKNGLTMELHSSEPGVQFYDAAKLDCPAPGLDGAHYGAHAGLCLEPQAFPDSPNRRHFTDASLRPESEYRHVSEFRFAWERRVSQARDVASPAPRSRLTPPEALAGAGFGQRLADFEAEIVHRGLLAHGEVLALRLTLGLLGRAGDVDRDIRLDLGMQVDRRLVQAERLDRLLERDVVAMDGEAPRRTARRRCRAPKPNRRAARSRRPGG